MKKSFLFLLIFVLSWQVCAAPIFPKLSSAARRIRSGRLLPRPSVSHLSESTNLALKRKLFRIAKIKRVNPVEKAQYKHPASATFQVQFSDGLNQETASAFAIKIRGRQWGVMAEHVRKNIMFSPHVKVKTSANQFRIEPITTIFRGNADGMDVALFEIPQKVQAFVNPLEPAEQAAPVGAELNIPGFTDGKEVYLPQEKVLFTTPMRMFLQKTFERDLRGFCGSPILDQANKVQAIYVGFTKAERLYQYDWFADLPIDVRLEMPDLHYAIPVQILDILAQGAEKGSMQQTGKMMYAVHHPIALLHPTEFILSVEQFRNGEKIAKVHKNPLIDPEHIEQFFELEENDILRVTLRRPQTIETPTAYVGYDINVTTGEVKTLTEKELLER